MDDSNNVSLWLLSRLSIRSSTNLHLIHGWTIAFRLAFRCPDVVVGAFILATSAWMALMGYFETLIPSGR